MEKNVKEKKNLREKRIRKHMSQWKKRKYYKKKRLVITALFCLVVFLLLIVGLRGLFQKDNEGIEEEEKANLGQVLSIEAKKVDDIVLKKVLVEVEKIDTEYYTDESILTLEKAVEDAETLLQKNARQREIEDAYIEVMEAIQNLEQKKQ